MSPALVRSAVKDKTESRNRDSLVVELRAELARKIAAHTRGVGERTTVIPGLKLYRRAETTVCYPVTYEPSFNIFVQGRKRVTFGGTTYLCDESTFLLTSVDVPTMCQILAASNHAPLLALLLKFDMVAVREILTQEEVPRT
jgi:hypothetical protein